jgi:hypothetical protein
MVEASVDLILAISDDEELLRQADSALHLSAHHLRHGIATRTLRPAEIRRVVAAMGRLSDAIVARCEHLRVTVLPTARALYRDCESLDADLRTAA